MAEEQAEAMDEADLDQEKGKAEQKKIEGNATPCRRTRLSRCARQSGERKENQNDRSRDGLHESQKADEISAVDKYEPALSSQCHELRQEPPREEAVEERAIISCRTDVEFVIGEEGRSAGA